MKSRGQWGRKVESLRIGLDRMKCMCTSSGRRRAVSNIPVKRFILAHENCGFGWVYAQSGRSELGWAQVAGPDGDSRANAGEPGRGARGGCNDLSSSQLRSPGLSVYP